MASVCIQSAFGVLLAENTEIFELLPLRMFKFDSWVQSSMIISRKFELFDTFKLVI